MNAFELAHGEQLALGERLSIWIGRYESSDPSLIFVVEDDGFVGFYGSAEGAALVAEDRRYWQCCVAYWSNLLDNNMQDAVLRTFLYDSTKTSCHEDEAACRVANAAREEVE